MNPKYKELYSYFKSNGLTDLDEQAFLNAYSDPNKSKELHSYLKENDLTDLDEQGFYNAYFGSVKKKEPTVSQSGPKQGPSSSATSSKEAPQRSASSQPENNIYKGYPGKEGKSYRLDESSGKPVWYEYSETVFKDGKQVDQFNKPITNPGRVDALNKYFKKQASTSEVEEVFTGYPGKEKNQYRIRNGSWQRLEPNKDWVTITNQGSIEGLNKQFGKTVKYAPVANKDAAELAKKDLQKDLATVNSSLIDKEEEEVVKILTKQFPNFKFTQAGMLTDEITVTAPNGNQITVPLDNWTTEDDLNQSVRLREFIEVNSNDKLNKSIEVAEKADKDAEVKAGFNANLRRAKPGDPEYLPDTPENMQPLVSNVKLVTKDEKKILEEEQLKARGEYLKQMDYAFSDAYNKQKEAARTGKDLTEKEAVAMYAAIPTTKEVIERGNEYANDIKKTYDIHNKKMSEIQEFSDEVNRKLQSGEITEEDVETEYKPILDQMIAEAKLSSDNIKEMVGRLDAVDKGVKESVASEYVINEAQGSFGGGIAYKFVKGMTYLPRLASYDMTASDQEALVRSIVGGGTTGEYMESEDRSDIVKTLFSLSESMGALAAGAAFGGGGATYAAFYGQSYYEMKDELDQVEGMTDTEKVLMSAGYGALSSLLEKFGIDYATQKTAVGKKFMNNIMLSVMSGIPKNASKEFIDAAMLTETKNFVKKIGADALRSGIVEGGTEGMQALSQVGIKEVYDWAKGTEYFNNKSGWEILSDVAYESYLGALGGGIMNVASSSPKVITEGVQKALTADQVEVLINSAKIEGMSDALITNLKSSIISGKITKEEAKEISESFNTVVSKVNSMPDDMPVDKKSVALDLMIEKEKIERQIIGKDENLVVAQKNRISEINNSLQKLSQDAIQKQTTDKGVLRAEQPEVGLQEVGKGNAEQEVVAEKGKEEITIDKPSIASNSLEELNRVKSVSVESEDGATFNLDGTKYEGGGLIVPVASKNTTAEEITPEMIADFVEENSGKIGDANTVKVGIYKFPNSNQMSIDLNVVAPETSREQAIEFAKNADQESLFDLGTFENVKTGGTGVNPVEFTDDQFKEIARALNEGRVPDVFKSQEDVAIETEVAELEQLFGNVAEKQTIDKQVSLASRAIAKILPKVKIVLHKTEAEYRNATGETDSRKQASRGEYNPETETIHINGSSANNRTVAHEVFHAVLLSNVSNDAEATELTNRMISAVNKSIEKTNNKELSNYLEDFISNYDKNVQSEEKMAELVGYLAENFESLPLPTKNIIKQWIDSLLKRFGLKPMTDNEIVELMNTIAGKVATGEEIDMNSIFGVTTEINPVGKSRKQVKVKDSYNLSFVTKEDIIDIDSLINEISEKKQKVWFWVADQLGRGHYYDAVLDGDHFLDAGPSFALDPVNRENNIIWASGANKKTLQRNIDNSDYIFIVSGSPEKSKLFNKTVANLIRRRIESSVDFDTFKNELLESKPTSKIKNIIEKYNSYDELFLGPDRKEFIIAVNEQKSKGTKAKELFEKYNAFVDPNSLRDGFYEANDFEMGDIMLVLKADGLGGKSNHSTYETDILGSVVGVPDKKVNAYDIMPDSIKDSYAEDISRTQQLQVVAPYGIGIKDISKRKQLSPELKTTLTSDGNGNYVFHHYSEKRRDTIKPGSGANIITGKDEGSALSAVGGLAQYYTMKDQVEPGVGSELHTIVVPEEKVYDFYKDPMNFIEEAEKRFEKVRPGQSFNPNYQLAFLTQVANENGYDMVVAPWRNTEYRAQTTLELKPIESNIPFKDRKTETYEVGDKLTVYGAPVVVTSVNGDIVSFEGEGTSGSINVKKNGRLISRRNSKFFEERKTEANQMEESIKGGDRLFKIVNEAKNKGFSDAAIRLYLKNNGYSDTAATSAIIEYGLREEGVFIPKNGKIIPFLSRFRRRYFSARAFRPKSVFNQNEIKEASVARNLNNVDQNVADFNRLYKKYKGDKNKLRENFDLFVRGDKTAKLPDEFIIVANSMRNHIDSLSNDIIESGLVDESMIKTIKDNIGQYLTRSYEVWDNKNWKDKVDEEVVNRAKNFLKEQYRSWAEEVSSKEDIPVDEVLENLVTNKINEMLDKDASSSFVKGSKLGSKDMSVLKERTDIPFELRALMGEYTDVTQNYARTILKLSALAANHKFLTEVKSAGMGVYLFEKNDPRRPAEFNTMIAAEGSVTMNPLNGLYTTKEIAEAFESNMEQMNKFWEYWMKTISVVKWSKTIASIGTHMKNLIGNLGFVWINGHWRLNEVGRSAQTVINDVKRGNKADLRARMDKYIDLGIVKQSAGIGEIRDMFKDANFDISMAERLSGRKVGILGKAKRLLLKGKKGLEDIYQAEDDFFKIIAYENELSRYSKAIYGKSKNDLTEEERVDVDRVVAEIVKNAYPTYSRVPEAISMIRRLPFLGNFISFQAESYRTAYNTIAISMKEVNSENPDIRKIGAQRLVGSTSYLAAKTAILSYFSHAAGTGLTGIVGGMFNDDEEDKKDKDIRRFVAPWSKNSDLIVLKADSGVIKYYDFSASDPHGGIKKALNAFLAGDSGIDSFIDAMASIIEPFVGEEMTTAAILDLRNNTDKYGGAIYNKEASFESQSADILAYVYKLLEPGTASSARRFAESNDKLNELLGTFTGMRMYEVNVAEQFGFKMKDYSDRIAMVKKIYSSEFYSKKATEESKKEALAEAEDKLNNLYSEIRDVYNSAERLGVDRKVLMSNMNSFGNIGKYDIFTIVANKKARIRPKE